MKRDLKMKSISSGYKRLSLLFGLLTLFAFCAMAENDDVAAEMKKIKQSEDFVYDESYNENKDVAFDSALQTLVVTINMLRNDEGLETVTVADVQPFAQELSRQLSGQYNVMVYMPIVEALKLTHKDNSLVVQQAGGSMTSVQTGTSASSGGSGGIVFVPNNSSGSAGSSSSTSSSGGATPSSSGAASNSHPLPGDVTKTISRQDNWTEIKNLIAAYKQNGKIKDNGFTQSWEEVPEDAYSIFIDDMYGIMSVMSPKNSGADFNYKTNRKDSNSNYTNYYVIVWYR